MNRFGALCILLAACSSPDEKPNPNPPPTWGVPISGGTLLVSRDGAHAIVADPDRDRIVSVDLASRDAFEIALEPGDEPGRLVEDGAGRIHVALRHGGALFTMDSPTATTGLRRAACGEPRGVAWQAGADLIHVACAGGELVSFAPAAGEAVRTLRLDRDLRDIIVDGANLKISRFRTAELLTIDAAGTIIDRATSPIVKREVQDMRSFPEDCPNCAAVAAEEIKIVDAVPAVAWRTLQLADGSIVVSHQRQIKAQMKVEQDGYGQGCEGGPVEHAVTVMRPGQPPFAVQKLLVGSLPIDAALSPRGDMIAFAMAGTHTIHQVATASLLLPDQGEEKCGGFMDALAQIRDDLGAPTSIAYLPNGKLAVYYPESPSIVIHDGAVKDVITLPGGFGYDAGRALFHTSTRSGLACASCHPEGRDDGLVWEFEGIGVRRTQNLAGHILARAPYHWNGDMADLDQIMHDVFSNRMGGGATTRSQSLSLGPWLDRIPAPRGVVTDVAAVERGRALFDNDAACATCHKGAALTNNELVDVGTGGRLKVPSLLGIGARAPFMHDGCATTLGDRFSPTCGGALHGQTAQLTTAQVADLVAYLESL